jgi:catechol 1,2-dioxygenase
VTTSHIARPVPRGGLPPRELGADIALDPGDGQSCLITGRVTGPDGEPIGGAQVDVWQANAEGF